MKKPEFEILKTEQFKRLCRSLGKPAPHVQSQILKYLTDRDFFDNGGNATIAGIAKDFQCFVPAQMISYLFRTYTHKKMNTDLMSLEIRQVFKQSCPACGNNVIYRQHEDGELKNHYFYICSSCGMTEDIENAHIFNNEILK